MLLSMQDISGWIRPISHRRSWQSTDISTAVSLQSAAGLCITDIYNSKYITGKQKVLNIPDMGCGIRTVKKGTKRLKQNAKLHFASAFFCVFCYLSKVVGVFLGIAIDFLYFCGNLLADLGQIRFCRNRTGIRNRAGIAGSRRSSLCRSWNRSLLRSG